MFTTKPKEKKKEGEKKKEAYSDNHARMPIQAQSMDVQQEQPTMQLYNIGKPAHLIPKMPLQMKAAVPEAATPEVTLSEAPTQKAPVSQKPNNTGIPDAMKARFENLSGFSFDDVKVHYNSDKPAQLQALAYAQGNQVYMGPGQEKHLGHELGHVVQQKQGRVRATTKVDGVPVNDDDALEQQADSYNANHEPAFSKNKGEIAAKTAQFYRDQFNQDIMNLEQLNKVLVSFNITPVTVDIFRKKVKGVTLCMVNQAISNLAERTMVLSDKFLLLEVLQAIKAELEKMVCMKPNLLFVEHGRNKHFMGPNENVKNQEINKNQGTKFTGKINNVNQKIEEIITHQIKQIREIANGTNTIFYLTTDGIEECNGLDLTVQFSINYLDDGTDRIEYHGYPSEGKKHGLTSQSRN